MKCIAHPIYPILFLLPSTFMRPHTTKRRKDLGVTIASQVSENEQDGSSRAVDVARQRPRLARRRMPTLTANSDASVITARTFWTEL